MDKEQIQELIRLVEESGINELEVWEGKRGVRISKGAGPAQPPPPEPASQPEAQDRAAPLAPNLKQLLSPMVGTFYRAPSPGAEPFVDVGQEVRVGQTVCIIEAMKLMNEIGCEYDGVVREILVENAQPVEYGQALFLIETK